MAAMHRHKLASALVLVVIGCGDSLIGQRPPAPTYEIQLKTRRFTPPASVPKALDVTPTRETAHVIVQFWKPLSAEQHAQLEKQGIRLLSFLGGTSYWATVPGSLSLSARDSANVVRWIGTPQRNDKIHPALTDPKLDDWALAEKTDRQGAFTVLTQVFSDVPDETALAEFRRAGVDMTRHGVTTWTGTATRAQLLALADLDAVKLIEPGPTPFLPLNDTGRRLVRSDGAQGGNFANPQPAYRVGGTGADLGICDTGIDQNHTDFSAVAANGTAGASRVYNQRPASGAHGTHVASIAAGSGINSANNGLPAFGARGHAPTSRIGDYPSFGAAVASYHGAIVTDGTDATNHSYVQSFTVYSTEAADLDSIIRGDAVHNKTGIPARPQVWAAGNNGLTAQYGNEEGYYAVFTSAKNSLSVGSVDTLDGRLSDFSSLGPTFDGRIKPDVVAPGCADSIASPSVGIQAAGTGTQGYTGMCGTSMAAPAATGLLGLAMDQFQQTYGNQPGIPSTYKAIVVQTATDLVKTAAHGAREFNNPDTNSPVLYHAGPDFASGYGLVDAEALREFVTRTQNWRERTIQQTGNAQTHCFTVLAGSETVKVTLAWDDLPGDTATAETAAKLVNDLDLELYDPAGNRVLPWTLDPLPLTATPGDGALDPITPADVRPAYRGADHRNNVEMATACGPAAGTWRAVVRGFSLPMGTAQPYSLVTSHPMNALCGRLPPKRCELFPELCPFRPICQRFPQLCEQPGFAIPGRDVWQIGGGGPVPIDEICKYVIDCPGCRGGRDGYCPGWRVEMQGVPAGVIASAINERGEIVKDASSGTGTRALELPRRRPGDQWFIVFSDTSGRPFDKPMKVGFRLKPSP